MSANFKDHFSGHAADYREYRPEYPPELFDFLTTLVPRDGLVWDCGAGNGQATVALASRFEKVFATDASAEQISQAERHPHVMYAVAPAERCPLPDQSASLVTVAQALHWFDLDGFYHEVKRVGRAGACIAVWTYDFHDVEEGIDPVLDRLQRDFVGPYWPPERKLVEAGYRTIPFPFQEIPAPEFAMTADWNLSRLLGYMNTWSATKAFVRAHGFSPVDRLAGDLAAAWGDPATVRTVRWRFYLRVGRIHL